MKKYISLTAVAYEEGDGLGQLLAWFSLLPQALLVAQATAVLLAESGRRRAQAGSLLLGQVTNELCNSIVKRIVREPRPYGSAWWPCCDCCVQGQTETTMGCRRAMRNSSPSSPPPSSSSFP